jgi:RNA polymerase subunit RPABC4/transcription elongation factor Spt4
MNWNNISLIVLGLASFFGAFVVALWVSLVIWTFRDMRARTRDAFAQLLASLMVLVLGPFGIILYFILRPRETLAEKYERSLEEEALLQDIEERNICPGCKQPIEPDYVLCPICHTRLRHPCLHCGRLIHPRWSVCPYCAQSQRPVPGLERAGQVTLLDLEKEETLSPAFDQLPDRSREDREIPRPVLHRPVLDGAIEPATSTDLEEQMPVDLDLGEWTADEPDDDTDSTWHDAADQAIDHTRETQPLDIKAVDKDTPRRPLSLFGQR